MAAKDPLDAWLEEQDAPDPLDAWLEEQPLASQPQPQPQIASQPQARSFGVTESYEQPYTQRMRAPDEPDKTGGEFGALVGAASFASRLAQNAYDVLALTPRLYGRRVPDVDFYKEIVGRLDRAGMYNEANAWEYGADRVGSIAADALPILVTGGMASVGQASTSLIASGLKPLVANAAAMGLLQAANMKALEERTGVKTTKEDVARTVMHDALGLAIGIPASRAAIGVINQLSKRPLGELMRHTVSNATVGGLFGAISPHPDESRSETAFYSGLAWSLTGAHTALFPGMSGARHTEGAKKQMDYAGKFMDERKIGTSANPPPGETTLQRDIRISAAEEHFKNTWAINRLAKIEATLTPQELMREFGIDQQEAIRIVNQRIKPEQLTEIARSLAAERVVSIAKNKGGSELAEEAKYRLNLMEPVNARMYEIARSRMSLEQQKRLSEALPGIEEAKADLRNLRLEEVARERISKQEMEALPGRLQRPVPETGERPDIAGMLAGKEALSRGGARPSERFEPTTEKMAETRRREEAARPVARGPDIGGMLGRKEALARGGVRPREAFEPTTSKMAETRKREAADRAAEADKVMAEELAAMETELQAQIGVPESVGLRTERQVRERAVESGAGIPHVVAAEPVRVPPEPLEPARQPPPKKEAGQRETAYRIARRQEQQETQRREQARQQALEGYGRLVSEEAVPVRPTPVRPEIEGGTLAPRPRPGMAAAESGPGEPGKQPMPEGPPPPEPVWDSPVVRTRNPYAGNEIQTSLRPDVKRAFTPQGGKAFRSSTEKALLPLMHAAEADLVSARDVIAAAELIRKADQADRPVPSAREALLAVNPEAEGVYRARAQAVQTVPETLPPDKPETIRRTVKAALVEKPFIQVGEPGPRGQAAVARAQEMLGEAAQRAPRGIRAAGERARGAAGERLATKIEAMTPQERVARQGALRAIEVGLQQAEQTIEGRAAKHKGIPMVPPPWGTAALATGLGVGAYAATRFDDDERIKVGLAIGFPAFALFSRGKMTPTQKYASEVARHDATHPILTPRQRQAQIRDLTKTLVAPAGQFKSMGKRGTATQAEVAKGILDKLHELGLDQNKPKERSIQMGRDHIFQSTSTTIGRQGPAGKKTQELLLDMKRAVSKRYRTYESDRDLVSTGRFEDNPGHELKHNTFVGGHANDADIMNRLMDHVSVPSLPKPTAKELASLAPGTWRRILIQLKTYFEQEEADPADRAVIDEAIAFYDKTFKVREAQALRDVTGFNALNSVNGGRFRPNTFRDEAYAPPDLLRRINKAEYERRLDMHYLAVKTIAEKSGLPKAFVSGALEKMQEMGAGKYAVGIENLINPIAGKASHIDFHRLLDAHVFIDWDPVAQANSYVIGTDLRLEFAPRFGSRGELANSLFEVMRADGYSRQLTAEMFDKATEQHTRIVSGFDTWYSKAIREADAAVAMGALGLFPLAQLTQFSTPAPRAGIHRTVKNWIPGIRGAIAQSETLPNWYKKAFGDETVARVVALAGASTRASHLRQLASQRGVFPRLLNAELKLFAGLGIDRAARNVAALAGAETYNYLQKSLEFARRSGNEKRVESMKKEFHELFEDPEHAEMAHRGRAKMEPGEDDFLQLAAAEFMSRRINHRTDPADMPALYSHPVFRSFYTLGTFAYRAGVEWLNQLDTFVHGNKSQRMRLVSGWGFQTLGGILTAELMRRIRTKGLDEIDEDPLWHRLVEGAAYAGQGQWLWEAWEAANAEYGNPIRSQAAPSWMALYDAGDAYVAFRRSDDPTPMLRFVIKKYVPTTPLSILGAPTKKELIQKYAPYETGGRQDRSKMKDKKRKRKKRGQYTTR